MYQILLKSTRALFVGLISCLLSLDTQAQGYTVKWSDPTTYNLSCGSLSGNKWTISNDSCVFLSAEISAGGQPSDPDKRAAFSISVIPTGNMESDDYLIVNAYSGGALKNSVVVSGDTVNANFTLNFEVMVPASSKSRVEVLASTDNNSEKWRINDEGITVSFPPLPLPVELESFAGRMKGNTAVLEWITRAEINNDYFTVERSGDGVRYDAVARIQGKGTTTTASYYTYTEDLDDGTLVYYRLKQTDFNGDFKYMGKVITLRVGHKSTVSVFPNPVADDSFHILVSDFKNEEVAIELRDINGKVVFSKSVIPDSEIKDVTVNRYDMNIQAGLYLVSVKSSSSMHSERLFIQD